ncbi:ABC transporter ATP-binding protein [Saccharibacillus sacchari]|uniref:ABC transporter ATP-binding protein n=2 Tax=Saccharibacillus sacchari TaxID=456493 RepID=UPI0004BA7459|nr:ABC transporter ATP-binding protein [Saccharibacillus sacchari]
MSTRKKMLMPLLTELPLVLLTIAIGAAAAGLNLFKPLLLGMIIGELASKDPESKAFVYVGAYLCVWGMSWLVSLSARRIGTSLDQKILVRLRVEIWTHLLNIPLIENERQPLGRMQTYAFSDLPSWAKLYGTLLAQIAHSAVQSVGSAIALTRIDFGLALQILPFLTLGFIIPLFGSKTMVNVNRAAQDSMSDMSETFSGLLRGSKDLLSVGAERWGIRRFEKACMRSGRTEVKKSTTYGIMQICGGASEIAAYILVLAVGGQSVLNGELGIGELIGFLALIEIIFFPARHAVDLAGEVQAAWASASRVLLFLAIPEAKSATPEQGDLILEGLSFRYPGGSTNAVHSVDCILKKGERIVVVGASGSGKSTFVKLISGFYEPSEGRIVGGGRSAERIMPVWQESVLFDASIRDNLNLGRLKSERKLKELAADFNMDTVFEQLPHAYDTVLTEGGDSLSGGQKKRVALIRALLAESDVYVFDEPTAGLDRRNADLFWQRISKLGKNAIVIVVTHLREETRYADRVLEFREGRLSEREKPFEW